MVTFNLHHGQSRIAETSRARPTLMRWRGVTPKRQLMFAIGEGPNLTKVDVRANAFGDVAIDDPRVMTHLAILGYPILRDPAGGVECQRLHDDRCFVNEGTGQIFTKRLEPSIGGPFVVDGEPHKGVHDDQCGRCQTGYGHEELVFRSDRESDPLASALPDEAVHLTPYRHVMHPVSIDGELHCWCEGESNG